MTDLSYIIRNNPNIDEYVKLLIQDISKIEYSTDEQIITTVQSITNFLKIQYNLQIPQSVKEDVQISISKILSELSSGQKS